LAVNEGVTHGKILHHARHRFINRSIAMRVILTQYFAHDAGRLTVGGIGTIAHIPHGIENAPMDRLETVANIGQGTRHNHAHGVIEISRAHLAVDIDLLQAAGVIVFRNFRIFRFFGHIFSRCLINR